jgi:hypothetical protein
MTKKVLAHQTVSIRAARSGKNSPLIVSIPKIIVDAINIKKKDIVHMYTDGERVCFTKLKEPEL